MSQMATPVGVDKAEIDEEYDVNPRSSNSCSKGKELMQYERLPPPQPFTLPHGWFVEEKPRLSNNTTRIDRYYYELDTGRKFRSLLSVRRYLTEGIVDVRSCTNGGMIPRNENTMQVISHTRESTLPHGWFVEEKPRLSNTTIKDKYYYEPGTGRKFRSLLSVQRYLTEGIVDVRSCTTGGMIPQNENTMQVITHTRESTSFIKLPNDWIVKKKPRNNNYAGVTDMTDIEPGTRRRFRSLKAVERYLTGGNGCTATTKPGVKPRTGMRRSSFAEEDKISLKGLKHSTKSTVFDSTTEINSGTDNRACMHNLSKPPAKVKWVLSGSGGCWNPFLGDSIVPDSEKLKWSEAFVLSINS